MQQIMMKVLIISEVALLSEEIEDAAKYNMKFIHRPGPAAPGGGRLLLSKMQSQLKFDSLPKNEEPGNERPNDAPKRQDSETTQGSFSLRNSSPSPKGRNWANAFKKVKTSYKKQGYRQPHYVDPVTKAKIEKMLEWDEPRTKQTLSVSKSGSLFGFRLIMKLLQSL